MRFFFFPIETINRELDYKLFLACTILNKNNSIYIGQHDTLYSISRAFKYVLYLGKNLFLKKSDGTWVNRYDRFKKNKFKLVHLDEEGAFYQGNSDEWKRRLSRRLNFSKLNIDDYVFTWGDFQRNYYKNIINIPNQNIITTGNPRFDIIKNKFKFYYEEDVNVLKRKYKKFVLISGSFQFYNNTFGHVDSFTPRLSVSSDKLDNSSLKNFVKVWRSIANSCHSFIELVTFISLDFPDINFIYRPHPSEDLEIYKSAFKNLQNVFINREGNVAPWLLACEFTIQNNCTTSVEGFLANKLVVNYKNSLNPSFDGTDILLPKLVSINIKDKEKIKDLLKTNYFKRKDNVKIFTEEALSLLKNLNKDNDSFKIIGEKIIQINNKNNYHSQKNTLLFFAIVYYDTIIKVIKSIIRPFFVKKDKIFKAYSSLFMGFNKVYIEKKIDLLSKHLNKEIKIKFYNSDLFKIYIK